MADYGDTMLFVVYINKIFTPPAVSLTLTCINFTYQGQMIPRSFFQRHIANETEHDLLEANNPVQESVPTIDQLMHQQMCLKNGLFSRNNYHYVFEMNLLE